MTSSPQQTVLVLMGGPDAERPVSIDSGTAIAEGLSHNGTYRVEARTIDRLTSEELAAMPGDVVFPALHGRYGEGGVLQDVLERDGRPYVGSGPRAARIAMDKMATLLVASRISIPTLPACVLDTRDATCSVGYPCVVKPVHDGSSVGLHICKDDREFARAIDAVIADRISHPDRTYMVEPFVQGFEITIGVLDSKPLPPIRIRPASGVYDYDAKYVRNDTVYDIDPNLENGLGPELARRARSLCAEIGVRDLARIDFMVGTSGPWAGQAWLLEANTLPGFTSHSLVPKAASHIGLSFDALVTTLASMAAARANEAIPHA